MRKAYSSCVGRKYRLIPKLYRPFTILISGNFCNQYFLDINKIKFINKFFSFFYKSRWGYKIKLNISGNNTISEGDCIVISARTQKAAWKNLLIKLNYELLDYKVLKKRQYILNFVFLFLDVKETLNSIIFLDIVCSHEDIFKIFIIVNGYYIKNFNNIIYYNDNFILKTYDPCNIKELKELSDGNFNNFYNDLSLEVSDEIF